MEIITLRKAINGKMEAVIDFREEINGFGHGARLNLWVEDSDSRSELANRSAIAARDFLKRCISALDEQYPTAKNP